MKKLFCVLVIIFTGFTAISQVGKDFNVFWNGGLKAESTNGDFKIQIGGRVQFDVMWIHQDDSLNKHFDANNGAEIRRGRFYTSGKLYKNIKFKFQVDFAGARATINDAYIRLIKIPVVGNIQVGNFKSPFGLAFLTTSKYLTEMERPLQNVFDNDRDLGFMMFNQHLNKRLSWYIGYFYPSANSVKYFGNKYNLVFRLTGLPIHKVEQGYTILHLGASFAHQYHDNSEATYSLRPEAHLAPEYLNVVIDKVSDVNMFNSEFLFIKGSLSFESEYTVSHVNPSATSTLTNSSYIFKAYYGTVSWFITGEHKNYVPSKTTFDIIKPKNNFGKDGGLGAIEVSVRYSNIDLDDANLNGGQMSGITGGINWYLNPATKVAFNYVYTDVKSLGKSNIFQMRFQVVF